MATLKELATDILNDKNENLIPENIKKGVTALGVEGTLEPKIETDLSNENYEQANRTVEKIIRNDNITGDLSGEEYVTTNSDGTEVNISPRLKETKYFDKYALSNIQLTCKDDLTVVLGNVTNISNEDVIGNPILCTVLFLNKKGEIFYDMRGIIVPLKIGQTTQFNASTTLRYVNAYDIEVVIDSEKNGNDKYNLQMKLDLIKQEKETYIKPENLKKGISYLGVEGTLEENQQQGGDGNATMTTEYSGGDIRTMIKTLPNDFYINNEIRNINSMFANCYNLVNVSNFDTSNVTDMNAMFANCYNLVNVSNFDTSSVTDIGQMFYVCNSLTDVPNFNTSNVTNMDYMFYGCNNLSNNSIQNIVNMCLNSNITNSSYMNLNISNDHSPLRDTKFDSSYYSNRLDELTAKGWSY